jgi:putative DNA methylase
MSKKLIEVSLPLDIINDASAYDKMPGIGAHPKGIHHWWARLPLPSARAILFASLVDDPSEHPDKFPTESEQEVERNRLFDIIRDLTRKKIHLKGEVFERAYQEILASADGNKVPTVHDPFSGGGSIPLEGLRLGLNVFASDLNPIPVLINKAMLEVIPKYWNKPPINQKAIVEKSKLGWTNVVGFCNDILHYGNVVLENSKNKLQNYYPTYITPNKEEYKVVAWLWSRTIRCPNPACGCQLPLIRSFQLSKKEKNKVFAEPIIERGKQNVITGYEIKEGEATLKKTVSRSGAVCVCCGDAVPLTYIRNEGKENRIGFQMFGVVAEGRRRKVYLPPLPIHESVVKNIPESWSPDYVLPLKHRNFQTPAYGMKTVGSLFTKRQLYSLNTFVEEVCEIRNQIIADGGSEDYANDIQLFLSFAIDRCADFNNSLTRWSASNEKTMNLFGRQAIPMIWDFGEVNLLENVVGGWQTCLEYIVQCVGIIPFSGRTGNVYQKNATAPLGISEKIIVSTDPPYYDNICYADLSDFFYAWSRKALLNVMPDILRTIQVPKEEELIASTNKFGGDKSAAKHHFEDGFKSTFLNIKNYLDDRYPMTIYYAFKQEEEDEDNESDAEGELDKGIFDITLSTGWETLLQALVDSGFQITATWPIKASQKWRMVSMGANALTSYIVLACRPRPLDASTITRREYLQTLKKELPKSVGVLQHSNLAPVDMAQATIGPGMAIFSRFSKILEQDGKPMTIKTALSVINKTLDEILAEQEGDFDVETRWAISWFEEYTFTEGAFGDADALGRAKNTAVNALVQTGIIKSGSGKVKLISREELKQDWNPEDDSRIVVWELTQHLIKQLQEKGEIGAAALYKKLGPTADVARELAYRLFTICEKKGWAQEAQAYNSLVLSWNQIVAESYNIKDKKAIQHKLDI